MLPNYKVKHLGMQIGGDVSHKFCHCCQLEVGGKPWASGLSPRCACFRAGHQNQLPGARAVRWASGAGAAAAWEAGLATQRQSKCKLKVLLRLE